MNLLKLEGIIPATVTPMNDRFEIVEEELVSYVQWISKFRIGGLAVNVDTGEGQHLTSEERKKIISLTSRVVSKRFPLIAGVPPSSTSEAKGTAADAKTAGADALLVFPNPAFYGKPLSPELPYYYHKAIAGESELPIVLFQLQPDLGGYELTEETLLRLLEIPHVVAIKEASFDARKYTNMLQILKRAPRKIAMLSGNDNFIGESFVLGADGALIGFGTLATDLQVEMYEKAKKGLYRDAMEIWERIAPLEEVIFASPVRDYRARTKVALALQGIIQSVNVRPPLLPISSGEVEKVRAALVRVGIPIERKIEAKRSA